MKTRLVSAIVAAAVATSATLPAAAGIVHYQRARKSPEWFTRGVVYQIQPRAFTPEGTLKAAAAKLPYLKDLGVTPVDCSVSFTVEKKKSTHFSVVADDTDFSVKGAVSPEAIYARDAKFNGGLSFSIGPWGCWISKVVLTNK